MTDDVSKLKEQLSKLKLRRTAIINELSSIEEEHNKVERQIKQNQRPSTELIGKDAKGNTLRIGDSVSTLTKGKYHERIATVDEIRSENHIVISYLASKKKTWRVGHNLLKLE